MNISKAVLRLRIYDAGYTMQDKGNHVSPPIYLVIGPEGGFTKEEVTLAKEKGLLVTSLGNRILRAETAAISALTLVQFLLGDMG